MNIPIFDVISISGISNKSKQLFYSNYVEINNSFVLKAIEY